MAKTVYNHINFLRSVSKSNPKQVRKLLKQCSKAELKAVCECVLNVANRNCPINRGKLRKLIPHKKLLLNLAFNKASADTKRRVLIQKGSGVLPILLPIALSYLLSK